MLRGRRGGQGEGAGRAGGRGGGGVFARSKEMARKGICLGVFEVGKGDGPS